MHPCTLLKTVLVHTFKPGAPFALESGAELPELEIAYATYGALNDRRDNVVWICHALTANAEAADWWSGLVGTGKLFDPAHHFIVCANMIGSCYGSTGPASVDPATGRPYRGAFPLVTIRDMVAAHELLREELGIRRIRMVIGGSMGGQQALEWLVRAPDRFDYAVLLATNARHSPWGIAFNEAQRMAIYADPSVAEGGDGARGLEAARAIAMLSYRNYRTFQATQSETAHDKLDDFLASSYQRYQGEKLRKRFDVWSYIALSKAMDSHHLGRDRGGVAAALQQIRTPCLVVGIASDVLFPLEEQALIARYIPDAQLEVIDSIYGHDGFLIEFEALTELAAPLLAGRGWARRPNSYRLRQRLNGAITGQNLALPGTERF